MGTLKIVAAVVVLAACPGLTFAGVIAFDVADETVLRDYDFQEETLALEIGLSEVMGTVQDLPRLESAYLLFRAEISDRDAEATDLGCLRVCSFYSDGELAWESDHARFNSSFGKGQLFVFDVTDLVGYMIRDKSVSRKFAVVRCQESARSVRITRVPGSPIELRIRHSDPR